MKPTSKFLALLIVSCVFLLLAFSPKNKRVIVIDAGHGGKDYGAVHENHFEKDIVRGIAKQITNANNNVDIEFFVIGEEDVFIDLEQRVKAINSLKPDVLISLHVGSAEDNKKAGPNAYISAKNKNYSESKILAEKILKALNGHQGQIFEQDATVLNKVICPAVNLEVGYLTNPLDQRLMVTKEGQHKIGIMIYSALFE